MTTLTPPRKITVRDLLSFIVITAFYAVFPLLIVARWDWWPGWVYAALMIASTVISRVLAFRKDPGILAERANSLDAKDAKEWDKKLMPFVGMLGPLTVLLISGLDARFGWSPAIASWIPIAALAVLVLSLIFSTWAFLENKFFSGVVRIQTERGHHVIDTGPYHYLRHPGYASAIWMYLALPLLFGSLWGLIPALLTLALFILRTALEDKTLQEELPGYKEFMQRTRYRLFPGIW
jgi:protein-S-isoprenylcysteine O-methyltransferase Ste14